MRVLIVEDEYFIAAGAAAALEQAGCKVVGMAASVSKAIEMLDDCGCDAAVLDANLGGDSAEPVAAAMRQIGVPFLVTSGYAKHQQTGTLADAPYLAKPCQPAALVAAVLALRK